MKTFYRVAVFFVVSLALVFIGLHLHQRESYKNEMAAFKKDFPQINEYLKGKCHDCSIEPTDYGYKAVDLQSGKVFRVVLK